MGLSKEGMSQTAASATSKAKEAFTSIFAGVQEVEGRPNIDDDETLVIRAYKGRAALYLVSFVLMLIPPFIFGILLLLITYYFSSRSGVMVTNRRLVVFQKKVKPNMYFVREIPLKHINDVRRLSLVLNGNESFLEHLFGAGGLVVTWESPTAGTVTSRINSIYKPKKVEKAIKEAMAGAKVH